LRSQGNSDTTLPTDFEAVVIGGSAGSGVVIEEILSHLPCDFPMTVFVVQHLHESDDGSFAEHLGRTCKLEVIVPCDKQPIEKGYVFVAPANYHMLLERNSTIALSVDEKVKWSRPSIDVLFESAARAYGKRLIAIVLSGANDDGAQGMKAVKDYGGIAIVQSPDKAESQVMPRAAIEATNPDYVQDPVDISITLVQLAVAHERCGRPSHA
jgi:two-component system, chemotaxis family, protein-glutamate methylesterase/glutaminase